MTKQPKQAVDYLADYCNGKIKFEDAIVEFAKYHVTQAFTTMAEDREAEEGDLDGHLSAALNRIH